MKRILLLILKKLYIAPYWYFKICKYAESNKYNEEARYRLIRNIVKSVNKSANVIIECEGIENIPKKNGYVLFPNHQGLYDALILIETNEKPITFVMKKEIEKHPVLKKISSLIKALLIDRSDLKQSMKVILEMTKEVKLGRNFVIFAEGTRSRKQNELLDFKGGSFKSATKAKAPIVPVALMDSYKVFDNNSIEKVKVKISYLEPIYYDEYKEMKTSEIANEVKSRIEKKINKDIDK